MMNSKGLLNFTGMENDHPTIQSSKGWSAESISENIKKQKAYMPTHVNHIGAIGNANHADIENVYGHID